MERFEIKRSGGFTTIQNEIIKDKRLSLSALGLLTVFFSLPPTWNYSIKGLVAIRREKETAIKTAMRELKAAGYLTVEKLLPGETESGRIEYKYTVYDVPQPIEKQAAEEQAEEKQGVEILPLEVLPTENPPQYNNNQSIPYLSNNQGTKKEDTPQPPKRQRRVSQLTLSQAESFARFWEIYPRKVAKESAEKAWAKIDPPEHLVSRIILAVENQKKVDSRFREIRFTPHPATWLNGREWENTYETGGTQNGGEFRPSTGFRTDF